MGVESGKVWDNNEAAMTGVKRNGASYDAKCLASAMQPSAFQETFMFKSSVLHCNMENCRRCYPQKSVSKNYANFLKSGLPQRLLVSENGVWNDYPFQLVALIQEEFKLRKAIIEINFQGHCFLLDFVHMVQIDSATGFHKSIAWIDEHGDCFLPEFNPSFCALPADDHSTIAEMGEYTRTESIGTLTNRIEMELANSSESSTSENSKKVHCDGKQIKEEDIVVNNIITMAKNSKLKGTFADNYLHRVSVSCDLDFNAQGKLSRCAEVGKAYITVRKLLLLGMKSFISEKDIVGVFNISPTSSLWQSRLKLFQKQVEITSNLRGSANVRCAWLPSSKACAERIMLHGVRQATKPIYKSMYGTGIHLAPANRSNISASCSVDDNGVIYMVLCRVILGNMERVHPGSKQFQPSSATYDSGLDSFQNPNHYIVWDAHVDTHILPEYIVSLCVPLKKEFFPEHERTCDASEMYNCRSFHCQSHKRFHANELGNKRLRCEPYRSTKTSRMPISAQMPFSMLFAAVSTKVTHQDMDHINVHYDDFKRRKISRIELIKKLRQIIGDKLLISTIMHLQGKIPQCKES